MLHFVQEGQRENLSYCCKVQLIATFLAMLHQNAYVTGPEKTGLIYIKYTYSYYSAYLSLHSLYLNSVSFTEQLKIF